MSAIRTPMFRIPLALWIAPWCAVLFAGVLAAETPIEDCLVCHLDDTLMLELDDGSEMSLFVSEDVFLESVHGEVLVCTDCHEGLEGDHPSGATFTSRREYVIQSYDLCKKCHFETYTRTLESVHFEYLNEGFEAVPVCADCHGAHDVPDPHEKSEMMSRSCGACHSDVYDVYLKSVHGKALEETNGDVPGCADCHTAHTIAHPDTVRFRLVSPDACMSCHGDTTLAERYGMSPTIATNYLADFHGVTASFAATSTEDPERLVVVCIDCHGYHDIAAPGLVGVAAMQEKVEIACRSCHEDAPPGFPAAWLSHYPATFERAPLVFLVTLFYRIFIPFIVIGLLLQVFLHLYRVGIRR